MILANASLNMFMGVREPNVTFCIDISGSMYRALPVVQQQLKHYLWEQAAAAELGIARFFNLIAFSTEIYAWSERCVVWNRATVSRACEWIDELETKTGTNTLDALTVALADNCTTSVVLVTDGIADQQPEQVFKQVSLAARNRPVHTIFISATHDDDQSAIEFCQNLAMITRGFFKIATVKESRLDKITPICGMASHSPRLINLGQVALNGLGQVGLVAPASFPVPLQQSVPLTSDTALVARSLAVQNVFYPRVLTASVQSCLPSTAIVWSDCQPLSLQLDSTGIRVKLDASGVDRVQYVADAGSLLLNRSVLARSDRDGFYYRGKVLNQVLAHRFTIQFDDKMRDGYQSTTYQVTPIFDMVDMDDSLRHEPTVGQQVLARLDKSGKYAPGEIIHAGRELVVKFYDGQTVSYENEPRSGQVVWIPEAMFKRICYDFLLPDRVRAYLNDQRAGLESNNEAVIMPRLVYFTWPYFVPTCPLTEQAIKSAIWQPDYFRPIRVHPPAVDADELNLLAPNGLTSQELDERIRRQLAHHLERRLPRGSCLKSAERSHHQSAGRSKSPIVSKSFDSACHISARAESRPALVEHAHRIRSGSSSSSTREELENETDKFHVLYDRLMDRLYESEGLLRDKQSELRKVRVSSFEEARKYSGELRSAKGTAARFGNPKVCEGFINEAASSRKSRLTEGTMDHTFTDTTAPDAGLELRRSQVALREKEWSDKLRDAERKSEQRDEFRRSTVSRLLKGEIDREENNRAKSEKCLNSRRQIQRAHIERVESGKEDVESKARQKYDRLREKTNERLQCDVERSHQTELKEAHRIAYKASKTNERNVAYHDRLLYEQAARQAEQLRAQHQHRLWHKA